MQVSPRALFLVLLFINDLPNGISSQLSMYVDDTTIYYCFDSKSDQFNKVKLVADVKNNLLGQMMALMTPKLNYSIKYLRNRFHQHG